MTDRVLLTRRTAVFVGSAGIAGIALGGLTRCSDSSPPTEPKAQVAAGRLQSVLNAGVIRAGYGGFRPYTIANASDPKQPTGFLIDLFKEIARRTSPALRIEWVPITFETLKADVDSGRIDLLVDAVYLTIPRAQSFLFTDSFGYFGVGVAVVRGDDARFNSLSDLDRDGVVISLAEGWTSTEFAKETFKRARLDIVPVGDDGFLPLNAVVAGRADAALQDVPTVAQFVAANPQKVKAIGLDAPPARVAASFLLRRGSEDLRDFLNVALEVLRADGTIAKVASQWKLYNQFPARSFSAAPGN